MKIDNGIRAKSRKHVAAGLSHLLADTHSFI